MTYYASINQHIDRAPKIVRHEAAGQVDTSGATRTNLPEAPCFYCGDRGWCKHRQPDPVEQAS